MLLAQFQCHLLFLENNMQSDWIWRDWKMVDVKNIPLEISLWISWLVYEIRHIKLSPLTFSPFFILCISPKWSQCKTKEIIVYGYPFENNCKRKVPSAIFMENPDLLKSEGKLTWLAGGQSATHRGAWLPDSTGLPLSENHCRLW